MTNIEWTDTTWNPVTGCTKVSAGCKNCYAEKVAERFWGDRKFTSVFTHADRLDQPLRWRKPRKVFVNSMSDLFHELVPDSFIDRVFAVMWLARQHTFQVLTKRPQRMRDYCASDTALGRVARLMAELAKAARVELRIDHADDGLRGFHLPNVWLGVSCEDQKAADERIPLLLKTPAAVRFLSCEPLLGPVDLSPPPLRGSGNWLGSATQRRGMHDGVDWVIVGGESGPGARPCEVSWIRSIVNQCSTASVPCFVKQLGAQPVARDRWDMSEQVFEDLDASEDGWSEADGAVVMLLRDRKGGDPAEWSEDLRVREFPQIGGGA